MWNEITCEVVEINYFGAQQCFTCLIQTLPFFIHSLWFAIFQSYQVAYITLL
jgi:hypothetical protein